MPLPEKPYGVWLHGTFVGVLRQRGDHTRFTVHPSYADDPRRPVLGLVFEQDLTRVHAAALRVPPWFANLLPEGVQRSWIARQRGVAEDREMELLAEVGRDLPGAVTVLPLPPGAIPDAGDDPPAAPPAPARGMIDDGEAVPERFSLAGVQLKLSMVAAGDRLVVPMGGTLGDWIVKFPDAGIPRLPVVERATMELARASGIDVPDIRLVAREALPDTPDNLWTTAEDQAYAIRRFDRGPDRSLIHIEDLAQVRDVWPQQKYDGRYEVVAALVHRGYDADSLHELVRRIAFSVLVDNSDLHLKNLSLLYADPRRPVLSPAYDLVSVAPYERYGGDLALSLAKNKRADRVRLADFARLGVGLGASSGDLVGVAERTLDRAVESWPSVAEEHLAQHDEPRRAIDAVIRARARSLRSSPRDRQDEPGARHGTGSRGGRMGP